MKLKLTLIALLFSTGYLQASALVAVHDSINENGGNAEWPGRADSNNVRYARRDSNEVTRRETNDSTRADTTVHKKDKRGVFSITVGWQYPYQYLGSYFIPRFNCTYAEVRYKFWFGLFGAVAPQFLFTRDSFYYVGTNLTIGFDNEWWRNFHVAFSYTYCARDQNAVEELQDIFGNDFDVNVYYANKYITPEIRYDLTFGVISGFSISDISQGNVKVLGGDNVINAGLSHTFTFFENKPGGALRLKIGDYVNLGTANALLTRRVAVTDNSGGYYYEDVPYTGDKFSALNDEGSLAVYYTWRSITISPYVNFSVPFRNIAAEQAALPPVNINGATQTTIPDIATNAFFYGGVSLILKIPAHLR